MTVTPITWFLEKASAMILLCIKRAFTEEKSEQRWQEYTEELYEKYIHNSDIHDGVITHLESYILKCEVKRA